MRYKTVLIDLLLFVALSACGEAMDTHAGQPVTHRRVAFKKILQAFEPMGVQLRTKSYNADRFSEQARELARVKDGPWQYFGEGTNYPPTHANAKVWGQRDQFEAARKTFLQAADALVLAADSRNEKSVQAAYERVHDSCGDCHHAFRNR